MPATHESHVGGARLDGRVALVTGANHGIGAAVARRLAGMGAGVLITYLRGTNRMGGQEPPEYRRPRDGHADQLVDAIVAGGGRAVAVEADLSDPATVPMLFDRAEADLGPVDVLVNNASGWAADTFAPSDAHGAGSPLPVTAETVDRVTVVDMRAAGLAIAEFARRLRARHGTWGRIVGLTSDGRQGFPGQVTYGAAKAAQESYTRSAAIELAGLGVTANMVHPPITDTGWITDDVRAMVVDDPRFTHVATPEQVADVVAWLCTDAAFLVSGNVVSLR